MMEGIKFVTEANGKKVAVQLDLKKHGYLWEDIQDGLVAESRRDEQGIPFEDVKASLIKSGKLKAQKELVALTDKKLTVRLIVKMED